jgi:glycosyltransferase involved in cell wall biosynthesis
LSQSLVSVVTPFHNTGKFLAECIESVLAQTHSSFEYILVNNCSTDGSGDLAEEYARRDSRIRVIRRTQLLSQVQNYNSALAEISDASLYCKMVQADDRIFPECLQRMVRVFGESESIGLVSSYYLKGDSVRGSGFPHQSSWIPGKDMARLYLRSGVYVFGSPTSVMYRSSIVRGEQPFYDERLLHEDTEKCLQILEKWDFGFSHQVLSFLRLGNESISSAVRDFKPDALDWYIIAQRYAHRFLPQNEALALQKESGDEYYSVLAHHALQMRGSEFWRYHEKGLKTLGEALNRPRIALGLVREILWKVANPGSTLARLIHLNKHGSASEK